MFDSADLRRSLEKVVGSDNVMDTESSDDADWTGRFVGEPTLLVRPGSTVEVAEVVAVARRSGVSLVPRGGNTGLVGGSISRGRSILVSTSRLRNTGTIDPLTRQVTVGAGVTLHDIQEQALSFGLRYPVDFGARGTATIGGTVATNAGGVNVVRYGMTRRQIVGIEAVLGSGETVSHLGGLVKDNTGYDLAGLLCGSEGTLGIVTAVRVQLVPLMPHVVTALVSCDDVATAVDVVASVCSRLDTVDAAELVTADGLALVREQIGLEIAIPNRRIHLLLECSSTSEQVDVLSAILDEHQGIDVAVAVTPSQRERLWRIREEQTPSINRIGVPFKFDVTVPLPSLAPFVERIPLAVEKVRPGARTFVFGHAADGNMHVNVVGGDGDEVALTEQVLGEVVACGGSISAEHGIGTAKQPWLHMVRSTSEIDAMRSIKAALDPDGIMNPGVLLP